MLLNEYTRDRFFEEPIRLPEGYDDLDEEAYWPWLRDLFDTHGVCQLFFVHQWPYPEFGLLDSDWRVPAQYHHVALSEDIAMDAGTFNRVLDEVRAYDMRLKQVAEPGTWSPSMVSKVVYCLRMAAEEGLDSALVGYGWERGFGVRVDISGSYQPLVNLGSNAPGRLVVTGDGHVLLGSDLKPSQRIRLEDTRCWVKGLGGSTMSVTTVNREWSGNYVERQMDVDLALINRDALNLALKSALDPTAETMSGFEMLEFDFGGASDPDSPAFRADRAAEMVCRVAGEVRGRYASLEEADAAFAAAHGGLKADASIPEGHGVSPVPEARTRVAARR